MEKFITNHSKYIKEWRLGNSVRILKDVVDSSFLTYRVQRFDGKSWPTYSIFHTLAEAKKAARWMAEDAAMEAACMS